QLGDLGIRAVERRANEAVQAGRDADVLHLALPLRLRDAREQHARSSDHVAAGLEPKLAVAARFLHLGEPLVERLEIEGPLTGALRHAEPAAEVEITHVQKTLDQLDELLTRVSPRLGRQDAAAGMRVQADDARARRPHTPLELVELEQRHAELRVRAGRADVLVMTASLPGVDTNEDVGAAEDLRPRLERVEIVEREPYALLDRPLVLGARREIRREQDALAVDVREKLEDPPDLAGRHAFEVR